MFFYFIILLFFNLEVSKTLKKKIIKNEKKTLKKYNIIKKIKKIKKIKEKNNNNSGGHRVPHIPCFHVLRSFFFFLGSFGEWSRNVRKKKGKGKQKEKKKKRKRKKRESGEGESKEKNGPRKKEERGGRRENGHQKFVGY